MKLKEQIDHKAGLSWFVAAEDTEIPQLRKHATELANSPRDPAASEARQRTRQQPPCVLILPLPSQALTVLQSTETWILTTHWPGRFKDTMTFLGDSRVAREAKGGCTGPLDRLFHLGKCFFLGL